MSRINQEHLSFVAWPAYLLAFALFAEPLADAALSVWPFRPTVLGWRFASVGLFSGGLMTPLLALLIATVAAVVLEHQWVQRAIGILTGVISVVLLAMTVLFVFDSLATKTVIEEGGELTSLQYAVTVVKSVIKLLLATGAAGALSWAVRKVSAITNEAEQPEAAASGIVA